MRVSARGYDDGRPSTLHLTSPSPEARWRLHAADEVAVTLPVSQRTLTLAQRPRDLASRRVGVGAVLWDAALVLAAAVDALGPHALVGDTVVELGCGGCPLPSMVAGAAGAAAVATDRPPVLPLAVENVASNGLTPTRPHAPGGVTVAPLDWSDTAAVAQTVASMATRPPSLVLAADCVYADGMDGDSPSVTQFAAAAAALAASRSAHVWVAAEHRSDTVLAAADAALRAAFGAVERRPVPPAWPSDTAVVWECCGGGLKKRARGLGLK